MRNPRFSTQHYTFIAKSLNQAWTDLVSTWNGEAIDYAACLMYRHIVDRFKEDFLADNKNFDVMKFEEACGAYGE
jgi:hypothetical protein